MSETNSPGAVAALGAIETGGLGQRRVVSETSLAKKFTQSPIRAALIGSDRWTADEAAK
jgi:hypothetical protein